MRIAICDDERSDAAKIEFTISDLTQDTTVDYYASGKELLSKINKVEPYDCIFMDIYIDQENGMDVAREIKEMYPDVEIIFSTSSRDFAVDAFRVQATDYLVKPYSELDIVKAIARVKLNSDAKKPVILRSSGEVVAFIPDQIIRIESEKHYTKIVQKEGKVSRVHMSYSDVIDKFGNDFLEVKRGVAVNMNEIKQIQGLELVLTDGTVYEIARGRKDEVVEIYTRFITE